MEFLTTKKASIDEITDLENKISIKIHSSYKNFLFEIGGGIPSKKYILQKVNNVDKVIIIHIFCNVDDMFNSWIYTQDFPEIKAGNFYFIAETLGRECFVMNELGEIYLWDEDFELFKCFDTLKDLFAKLEDEPII